MMRKQSLIAAAVFAALSSATYAQTATQETGASQSAQTNPTQIVAPSAATGVESNVGVSGSGNNVRMESSATTNQSVSASQNTGNMQGMSVTPSQQAADREKSRKERRAERQRERQRTHSSQAAQTNPEQVVAPHAATGVESNARIRGDNNRARIDSRATTNQSVSASQNTGNTQGMTVSPGQNPASSGVPGMGAVPGVSGSVGGGASAGAGGTSAGAGGSVGSSIGR